MLHNIDPHSDALRMSLLELVGRHEEAISQLYATFATTFPEEAGFWAELADEERNHARWVRSLHAGVRDGLVVFAPDRFSTQALTTSTHYILDQVARTHAGGVSLVQAFSIAHDLENSMIERKFFQSFTADSAEVKRVLSALDRATEKHRQRIARRWHART
jgi:hypothetical protein